MSTANKLPANLPALPPVPDGWHSWEYMGEGYVSEKVEPFGYASTGDSHWYVEMKSTAIGDDCPTLHYIRAIKRPAKLKQPKQAQAVKAELWHRSDNALEWSRLSGMVRMHREGGENTPMNNPVFVLPADAASVERMIEQVAQAQAAHEYATVKGWAWGKDPRCDKLWISQAWAGLASLGITSAKGRK
jgi:hypothetical protein